MRATPRSREAVRLLIGSWKNEQWNRRNSRIFDEYDATVSYVDTPQAQGCFDHIGAALAIQLRLINP